MDTGRRGLVLGGGGLTGIAWETGLLLGLAEHGVDLSVADVVVGTSAGSTVGAHLTSGVGLGELFEAQLHPQSGEVAAHMSPAAVVRFLAASAWPGNRRQARAWLGRAALRARTVPEADRRAVIAQRLPRHDWPKQRLLVPAVDAETGEVRVFDKDSGVPLVDAVAASCAVPMVWPPVTIDGRRYIDGGVRTATNVDLATSSGRLVVLAPTAAAVRSGDRPSAQAAALGDDVRSVVLSPNSASKAASGRNPLDPARRRPAALAGRAQAADVAEQVRAVWT